MNKKVNIKKERRIFLGVFYNFYNLKSAAAGAVRNYFNQKTSRGYSLTLMCPPVTLFLSLSLIWTTLIHSLLYPFLFLSPSLYICTAHSVYFKFFVRWGCLSSILTISNVSDCFAKY